jgi:hypothetical protein
MLHARAAVTQAAVHAWYFVGLLNRLIVLFIKKHSWYPVLIVYNKLLSTMAPLRGFGRGFFILYFAFHFIFIICTRDPAPRASAHASFLF